MSLLEIDSGLEKFFIAEPRLECPLPIKGPKSA